MSPGPGSCFIRRQVWFLTAGMRYDPVMSGKTVISDKELLHSLDEKKRALEEIMHVAQTVERLQEGLQAVLIMKETAHQIPRHVLKFYRGLDERLRGHPMNKLSKILSGLEQAIRNDLGQILQLAVVDDAALIDQRIEAEADNSPPVDDVSRLTEDFRRRVQTAVYLRVLLREQGATTEPMELVVPTEQIQQQINALDERGQRCRKNMQVQVDDMLKDITQLLANEMLPDALKVNMRQTRAELEENLKHLKAGKSIENMPFYVDSFFLQDDESGQGGGLDVELVSVPLSDVALPGKIDKPESGKEGRGFFRCLWLWCVTSTDVSWKEIRNGQYRNAKNKK